MVASVRLKYQSYARAIVLTRSSATPPTSCRSSSETSETTDLRDYRHAQWGKCSSPSPSARRSARRFVTRCVAIQHRPPADRLPHIVLLSDASRSAHSRCSAMVITIVVTLFSSFRIIFLYSIFHLRRDILQTLIYYISTSRTVGAPNRRHTRPRFHNGHGGVPADSPGAMEPRVRV